MEIKEYINNYSMKKINESVWGDIRRSGNGVEKMEDSIEPLDRDGLYDYIKEHYDGLKEDQFDTFPFKSDGNKSNGWFQIPIFRKKEYGIRYSLIAKFKNNTIVKIALDTNEERCSEFIDILKEKFEVTVSDGGSPILITGKRGKLSNRICMDVIDTIIENVKYPILKKKEE